MHNGGGCFGPSGLWSAFWNGGKGGQICQGVQIGNFGLKADVCILFKRRVQKNGLMLVNCV